MFDHDDIIAAKQLIRNFDAAVQNVDECNLAETIADFTTSDYHWRGSWPFYEQADIASLCDNFWLPLRAAIAPLRRQEQIFFAGPNDADGGQSLWSCSMGHFIGLFDETWLGIPSTGKLVQLRYAEFHQVAPGGTKIAQSALFMDIAGLLQQVGLNPFPEQKGAMNIVPGPRAGNAIITDARDFAEGRQTLATLNQMIDDLNALNKSGNDNCPPEYLARTWHEDMAWYGPAGIGSTFTIERYQQHHQYPFREGLKNKKYHGHVARIAEGNYAAFFGWPNLTNSPKGGYLGLEESDIEAEMRVVDVYRREGEKLSENWVIIDLPHYFSMLGRDLIGEVIK